MMPTIVFLFMFYTLSHANEGDDWKTWSPWGECSVTCGIGTRTRSCNYRIPRSTDFYEGECSSGWVEKEECRLQSCREIITCDENIGKNACNINYENDGILYLDKTVQKSSGGECYDNQCRNCNDGFYSDGPSCKICPKIDNCNHRKCTSPNDNYCEWCEGALVPGKQFWNAYIAVPSDEKKTCQKACSWRQDSTRCFPGTCQDGLASNCVCLNGFGGYQCDEIQTDVDVIFAFTTLAHKTEKISTPTDPNEPNDQTVKWTNFVGWNKATSSFEILIEQVDLHGVKDKESYITMFDYGIILATLILEFEQEVGQAKSARTYSCIGNAVKKPLYKKICTEEVDLSHFQFVHGSRLNFKWTACNGGYIKYTDREANIEKTAYLKGRTMTRSYVFQWDRVTPYFPCIRESRLCRNPPLSTTDITEESTITISWPGWSDDDSGVEYYALEVFDMKYDGNKLSPDYVNMVTREYNITAERTQTTFILSLPGMYTVTVAVFDKAMNYRVTRCLVLYDNLSKVDKREDKRTIVKQATVETDFKWVTVDDRYLTVTWMDKFINKRHVQNHWLAGIEEVLDVSSEYDDHAGRRTINEIPNILGIVKFEIQYNVYGPNLNAKQPFTVTPNLQSQEDNIDVEWKNGDCLDITVRAYDVMNKYADDTITLYKDTTPPVIQKLWLSDGEHVNITIHRVEDFSKMTIEWDAFDYDSGLNTVEWRLFDNFTSNVVLHGKAEQHTQGMTQNLTECMDKYKDEPRKHSCYCTMFHGCYHKHFVINPKIADGDKHAGIISGKDRGVHDSDYYVEVTVTNKALLKTYLSRKITIDITPPHEGSVYDGLIGTAEVDYQQDTVLNAHWEGFFDKESGVEYYQYIFNVFCLNKEQFINSTEIIRTYNTFASYLAIKEGKYYISVVAVNRGKDSSNVVCSDGVTITTKVQKVTDFVFKGASSIPRLINDNGTVWFIDGSLRRHLLLTISHGCREIAVANLAILPKSKNPLNSTQDVCKVSKDIHLLAVVRKVSRVEMVWKAATTEDVIHDYEIGVSSSENSFSPDIVPFRTTHHHTHFRLNHSDLPTGKEFHIAIKTISKSGIEGTQSIGPFIIDATRPMYIGSKINVLLFGKYLVANWSSHAFEDSEDPFPLTFQFAVGHEQHVYDIMSFRNLIYAGPCKKRTPPTCTALPLSKLKWSLHSFHKYYFTLKATNLAGLSVYQTSEPYVHDIQLASNGIVIDLPTNTAIYNEMIDIEDIDFTTNNSSLAVKWCGFVHPFQSVKYRACVGSSPKVCDITHFEVASAFTGKHMFTGLNLTIFQVLFVTIEATTAAGSVYVSTDGVQYIDTSRYLTGIVVRDGNNCSDAGGLYKQHHEQDTRPKCQEDIDFQTSTTSFQAYWNIPSSYSSFVTEACIRVEQRLVADVWINYNDFHCVGKSSYVTLSNLDLKPGNSYRPVLKLGVSNKFFPQIHGNGVTIITNNPICGNMSISIGNEKVLFERMVDPDIKDYDEATSVVDFYEWAIGTDQSIHTQWHILHNVTYIGRTHIHFTVFLNYTMDFSKCRKLFIRGYNKAGVWSTMSREIQECSVKDGNSLIKPRVVIDSIGDHETSLGGNEQTTLGKGIYLEDNQRWRDPDVDYTPYKNILSATWPLLRHHNYTWAVINAENLDVTSYYKKYDELLLVDPCSHPDAIKCGITDREYINVIFDSTDELKHGKRYLICIYAAKSTRRYEKWTEVLKEVKSCSDGVTVDLTPPIPGNVMIGLDSSRQYQSSTSDIFINWSSFTDVEEYGKAVHSSGIKEYFVGIGTTAGGTDVLEFTPVGIVNHFTFNGLRLQDGHEYYAVVKGIDFAGRSSTAYSHPVKIDTSPPEVSKQSIVIKGRHLSNMSEIGACWRDVFFDPESGIDHYLWAVGSNPGQDDIITFAKTTLDCEVSTKDKPTKILEGHAYFITLKAINRANLISTASSWAYIYDVSPPVVGQVFDVSKEDVLPYANDVDYQTDDKSLSCYWSGFYDPHSTIKAHYIRIGTCPACEDVLMNQDIGVVNNFTLFSVQISSGIRYYMTVTACNTADLCSSVTSDGVIIDNSPPTPGVVLDGVDGNDHEYQSSRNYLSARWFGFDDPHSGLDYFTWRVGTKPGSNDIVQQTRISLSDNFVEPNLKNKLPVDTRIYITIRAYNKAGLSIEATSNGFLVDETPPVINKKPYLSTNLGSIKDNSLVFKNTIRVKWDVEDPESCIQRQYLSISSHKGGHFNTSSTEVNGIVREYTFTRLDLQDGGEYTVNFITCNGALLCAEAKSHVITVDSSPPSTGMFAIETDHAANLQRHVEGWMTWSRYKLWLSWLGFTDLHTRIDKYYVSVGSQYMADDLNLLSDSPQEFIHNQSGISKKDEGFVQTFEVGVKNLHPFEHIFVSVWAINKVGLPSKMIHSQFRLVPGGTLELIRRCSSVTCKGHCACAAVGHRCSINTATCRDISKDNHNNLLAVYDVTDVRPTSSFVDVDYTPSNVALAAKWHIAQAQGLKPIWYEWSAGLSQSTIIEGIFTRTDYIWHHIGQGNMAVLNLKKGQVLKEPGTSYSMMIRAWYSSNVYADFKTDGVRPISIPLSRRKTKGTSVVEQVQDQRIKDVDFIKLGSPFTISWSNVFIDDINIIDRFKVYFSTFPGGYDVHAVNLTLSGSVTSCNISRVPLTPGIVFYSNVVGYSHSGVYATESSDGILVDSIPPVGGTVSDGIGIHDLDYQNSSNIVSASWHGFSDQESGIKHYMWCVQTQSVSDLCDIHKWENVGIQRSVSRTLKNSIKSGTKFESLVYAVDAVGHKSNVVKSNGVLVDTTYPIPISMVHLDYNMALNPSFEDSDNEPVTWENARSLKLCSTPLISIPIYWNYSSGSCVSVIKSYKNIAMNGRAFLYLKGEISQTFLNIKINQLYRITFVVSHIPLRGSVLANIEGYLEINGKRHVFPVYTKEGKHVTESNSVNWHHQTFYFQNVEPEVTVKLGSITVNNGIMFDDFRVQEIVLEKDITGGKHVHTHVISLHQWTSIHASWSFIDPESPITNYMWAIGYKEGGTEIQGFKSVGLSNFAYSSNVALAHNSVIHITVVATNAAGLVYKAYAEKLVVDLTPPKIFFINDGIGADLSYQTSEEVSSNWDVEDPDSGIEICEWAVGYQPYGNEIQSFKKLPKELKAISKLFPRNQVIMQTIYVTLRCRNKAGLQSSLSTDGVKVSNLPPDTSNAVVQIIHLSKTEYLSQSDYQGDTSSLKLKWTGFNDLTGIGSYILEISREGHLFLLTNSITSEEYDISYCELNGLDMTTNTYRASVKAVNKVYLRSHSVYDKSVISSKTPELTGIPRLRLTLNNRTLIASWKDHFHSTQPMYFEVSAGTTLGGADIIQWQETKNTYLVFNLPPKIDNVLGTTIYMTVRGVLYNGMYTILNVSVKLSN